MNLYLAIAAFAVTIHTSVNYPIPKNPLEYDLNTCSGVFIGPDEVLTAAHCVSHSRGRQWLRTYEGTSYAVTVKKIDKNKDLALLKTVNTVNHPYAYIGFRPVDRGDHVYTVNSGGDMSNTYNEGMVVNVVKEDGVINLLHNTIILPGASGSGLFNARKELIGINVATVKNFSEAIDLLEIREFLDIR